MPKAKKPKAKKSKKNTPQVKKPKEYPLSSYEENWTLENVKEFIDTLMDITMCDDVQELKNHIILECIWKEMENKLQLHCDILKNFWNYRLHQQLFCPQPIYTSDLKIKLIELVYEKELQNLKIIHWHNYITYFDGCTKEFLKRIYNNLIKNAKISNDTEDPSVIIQYLYNKHIPFLIENKEDKILPRLKYVKEKLEIIDDID